MYPRNKFCFRYITVNVVVGFLGVTTLLVVFSTAP